MKPRIFLDMDGVLADFDAGAREAIGTDNTYKFEFIYGQKEFWRRLNKNPSFFLDLKPMKDAHVLFDAVRHLNPIILTALPKRDASTVDAQKRLWVRNYFGGREVITCLTHEKPHFCKPGDILIDDRAVVRADWEAAGGRYIVHTSADSSIDTLRTLGVLPNG